MKRFSVFLWNDEIFQAATYDEMHSRILEHHRARQKAAEFGVDFKIGKAYGAYSLVDNHEVTS